MVGVGPFEGQGAVEAFDLAVRLGVVRACVLVLVLDVAKRLVEVAGSVAGPVVGQDWVTVIPSDLS